MSNASLIDKIRQAVDQEKIAYERSYQLDEGQLAVVVTKDKGRCIITLLTDIHGPLILHWGAAYQSRHEWVLPQSSFRPQGTTVFEDTSAQTPFADSAYNDDTRRLLLDCSEEESPLGIWFVLKQSDTGRWIKDKGQNFFIPVAPSSGQEAFSESLELAAITERIIENEMGRNSWTLMHRLNLCYDLLDRTESNNVHGIALLYVWLRFSYIRQLDWQRNYNTKPRELGHAMDRLTDKLAGRYIVEPGEREFIRLMMTTLGTGKDAQRVRDEILNIMHRHHIKEVAGHFMEEWHQKLHNNATPDDIVICEAYLEFLRSNGDLELFYKKLEEGGVPRKRMETYERPITSSPGFIPHLKEALIHDFEHFLGILREVHSGADLGASINNSRYLFDADMHSLMDYIWRHRDDRGKQAPILLEKITGARRRVTARLGEHQSSVRDLLFLDLALEDLFRAVVEKNLDQKLTVDELVGLTLVSLENLCLSNPEEEFTYCLLYFKRLGKMPGPGTLWPLQAKAVVDRLQRGLGNFIDRYYQLLQPKAEALGNAFHAAPWTIKLFTEGVVRGRPAFVLSVLLRKLDPFLRKSADLGNWQVISPGHETTGVIEPVPHLKSIQGKSFSRPAAIIAGDVRGDEEIPEGVVAIITPASIDVLSHLAVRARNAHILFAVCYDPDVIGKLNSLSGHAIKLSTNEIGEVAFEKSREEMRAKKKVKNFLGPVVVGFAPFTVYAVSMNDFNYKNTGGKSNNLKRMQGKLPDWIRLPASAALPFGVFEKVLSDPANKVLSEQHDELVRRLNEKTAMSYTALLEEIKKIILALEAPDEFIFQVRKIMENAGLAWPENRLDRPESRQEGPDDAWTCIKRVWGSKWNERAYLSRKANGIPHETLIMAVLIQRVVEADYSFVIHTVNPFTNNNDEVYAEVVLGLGEALVANYPGRALSFVCKKGNRGPRLLSLPGKSVGLFPCLPSTQHATRKLFECPAEAGGCSLIFRSDSNGEDLAGYAGAGLYDSFMLPQPVKVTLDYTEEALVWDDNFRNEFLTKIAGIGTSVEKALGAPQDIEGAYSNGQYYVVQSRPQTGLENA